MRLLYLFALLTAAHGSTDVEEIKRLVYAVRTGEIDYESNDPRIGKLRALARTRPNAIARLYSEAGALENSRLTKRGVIEEIVSRDALMSRGRWEH
jgi:predicted aminopeptidase